MFGLLSSDSFAVPDFFRKAEIESRSEKGLEPETAGSEESGGIFVKIKREPIFFSFFGLVAETIL